MRIPRIHIGAEFVVGKTLALDKTQSHYLKNVLRLRSGAAFFLFNGREAIDYRATLMLDGKRAQASIEAAIPMTTESSLECEVIQGLGRNDHMDWMIQKTTELGVRRIILFNAERTQSHIKPLQLDKKLNHWRSVAISACEQCGRAILPRVEFHSDLVAGLEASSADLRLLLDFDSQSINAVGDADAAGVSILLGPEGGLTSAEIETAIKRRYQPVSLGPRVLRTETAATVALALVQSKFGDLA